MKTAREIAKILGVHHTSVGRLAMAHRWPKHKVRSKTGFRYEYDVSDEVLEAEEITRGRPSRKFKAVVEGQTTNVNLWDIWPVKTS